MNTYNQEDKLTIQIKNVAVRNQKYFVYKGKNYAINFDLLVINSNYFYENQEKYKNVEFIPLLNDNDGQIELPDEAIESFISICQNQTCQINFSSVMALQYLASKYEFLELTKITKSIIDEHPNELVFQSLLFKKMIEEKTAKTQDTKKEEETISKNIEQYIQNDQMLSLSIPSLERIIHQCYLSDNIKNKQIIIEFLFKVLDKYGKDASCLFNLIDFGKENVSVVNRLLNNYSEKFDFNMINSTLLKTTTELTSEMAKQKEKYERIFADMKKEIELQKRELILMKEDEKKRLLDIEKMRQEQVQIMNDELKRIQDENKKQMEMFKEEFNKLISENHKIIQTEVVQQDHRFIQETMSIDKINDLNEETRNYFINEVIKQNNDQAPNCNNAKSKYNKQLVERILFTHKFFDILSAVDEENNIKSLYNNDFTTKMNFISENLTKVQISYDIIENLFQRNCLNAFLIELSKNYDDYSIELIYPSNHFYAICDIFDDLIKQFPILAKKTHILYHISDKYNTIDDESSTNSQNDIFVFNFKYQSIINEVFSTIAEQYINKIKEGKAEILQSKFYESKFLNKIIIPSCIRSIGICSFSNCNSLEYVSIPPSVTSICEGAFSYTSIIYISIPSSVAFIGGRAFCGCKFLKEIILPSSLSSIEEETFKCCCSLKQITIPSAVKNINESAFYECSSLIEIHIPSSVTIINNSAFGSCFSLAYLLIPTSVTSIGNYAFSSCSSLVHISIPSSVQSIGSGAFSYCSSLNHIHIPSGITEIRSYCFNGCSSLAYVSIPPSIKSIKNNAFEGCSSLVSILIPSSVNEIEGGAFKGCSSLIYVSLPSSIYLYNNQFDSGMVEKKICFKRI